MLETITATPKVRIAWPAELTWQKHLCLARNKTVLWDSEYPERLLFTGRFSSAVSLPPGALRHDTLGRAAPLINARYRSSSLTVWHIRGELRGILRHLLPVNTIMSIWTYLLLELHKQWAKSVLTKREKQVPFTINSPSAICSWYTNHNTQVRQWWFSITQLSPEGGTTGFPNWTVGFCCLLTVDALSSWK